VCRVSGAKIQIHHLDDDPANNDPDNLAVLCNTCHDDTLVIGGFGRKLDADQIRLYRDDWVRVVAQRRALAEATSDRNDTDEERRLQLITSVAEAYRENEEYELLAIHYNTIGNFELRDKYVEQALAKDPADSAIVFLRSLQGRVDLIPADVVEREEAAYTERDDKLQRARFYVQLGRFPEAAQDYVEGIAEALEERERIFSAAYYLKELSKSVLADELFAIALKQASDRDDLWWQVRALQELGWDSELDELVLEHAEEIEASGRGMLRILLAQARGRTDEADRLRIEEARGSQILQGSGGGGVLIREPRAAGDEETSGLQGDSSDASGGVRLDHVDHAGNTARDN
jgi:tetratricopeptide (TPR) repeat protein